MMPNSKNFISIYIIRTIKSINLATYDGEMLNE